MREIDRDLGREGVEGGRREGRSRREGETRGRDDKEREGEREIEEENWSIGYN